MCFISRPNKSSLSKNLKIGTFLQKVKILTGDVDATSFQDIVHAQLYCYRWYIM